MKLKLLLSGLLLCVLSVSAQDVITMTDGTTIKAKVEEITDSAIKYRKHTNLTGPIYSVKLDDVSKIVYHNGETDLFNASAKTSAATSTAAVEYGQLAIQQPETQLNEAELLRMAEMKDIALTQGEYAVRSKKKANLYKQIGWIGGGVLVAGGVGVVLGFLITNGNDMGYYVLNVTVPLVAAGTAWCVAWNIAANHQMKKAKVLEAYSAPVIEGEMMRIGKNPLMGSINVMGDNFTRSRALGLGLTYKF